MKKKKRGIIAILCVIICLVASSLLFNEKIAGYNYYPFFKEKIIINPPVNYKGSLEPIALSDENQIKEFIELFRSSNLQLESNANNIFIEQRDNDNNVYLSIGLYSEIPDRTLGWEYLVSSDDSYISPTLNKNKEVYLVSPEAKSFMDNLIKSHWADTEISGILNK